ncbi:14616_t:CDS:2 [Entrophospora sp. SA101]|nr:14616_t:CDS:2 [Entrophospora sp. SA101]
MSRGVDCDSHQYFPLPTLSTSITRPQSTSSIDEIRKKFTEIETENNEIKKKYVEVEAENTDLKEIIKENARREAESMKLKARVEELERYKKENEKRFEKLEEKQLKNVNNFENIANVSDSVINHCIDTDTKSLDDDTSELIDERCDDTPASDIFDNTSNCDLRHESLTQCSAPSNCTESESLKDKEMNNIIDFLVERDNERIRNEIRERNRGGKLQREAPTGNFPKEDTYASNIKSSVPSDQKKEQGLIQEISIKDQNNITEISSNNIPQNHVPEIDYSTSDKDIICLYQNACDAEKDAIKANREEILCWCFYAKKSKGMVKDFMANGKVGEKKAKGQVYDFIIQQLPNTKRENLCKQTQKALRVYNLFEKIGMDKIQYIKTYTADSISRFTNLQIQTIIDHFAKKPDIEFTDNQDNSSDDLPGEAKLRVSNSTEVSNTSILSNSETIPVSTEIQASVFDDSSDSNLNPLENRLITTYNIGIELDKFI